MKYLLLCLFIIIISCKTKQNVKNCKEDIVNAFKIEDIKTGHFIVAVEKCNGEKQFGFCKSPFPRLSPLIIEFDSVDILKSYEKGIFKYDFKYFGDTSLIDLLKMSNWKPPIAHLDQDTTFVVPFIKEDSTANLKLWSRKYFKTLIKSSFHGNKSKLIDSKQYYIEYDIYEITIRYIYAGKWCIFIPRNKRNYSKQTKLERIEVPCYYIIEILEVKPHRLGHEYVIKF